MPGRSRHAAVPSLGRISVIPAADFIKSRRPFHKVAAGFELGSGRLVLIRLDCLPGAAGVKSDLAFFPRMLSPFRVMRWALWTMRSRMASAEVVPRFRTAWCCFPEFLGLSRAFCIALFRVTDFSGQGLIRDCPQC